MDRLHQAAGSERVIDLHGRIDRVRCMDCEARSPRVELQNELGRLNPDWLDLDAAEAPDGDADLEGADFSSFVIPPCRRCGGVLKPDVVFFGENVPRDRVDTAFGHLDKANAMLIVGSSLMVYSGFRFARKGRAASASLWPRSTLAGRERTRSLRFKAEAPCESALSFLLGPIAMSGSIQPARLKHYSSSAFVSPVEPERCREQHGADE